VIWVRRLSAAIGCAVVAGCTVGSVNGPAGNIAPPQSGAAAPSQPASPASSRPEAPGSCHARGSGLFSLPDPRCTPGAVSAAVTAANIHSTICRPGYSESVRPPESVTEPEKRASMKAYGDRGPLRDYEYDHLIPLELGGAANDKRNLWPEAGASPNPKDALEDRLRSMVCADQLTLAAARREIAVDWVSAYRRLVRMRHRVNRPA
jgi:hypothetical protein